MEHSPEPPSYEEQLDFAVLAVYQVFYALNQVRDPQERPHTPNTTAAVRDLGAVIQVVWDDLLRYCPAVREPVEQLKLIYDTNRTVKTGRWLTDRHPARTVFATFAKGAADYFTDLITQTVFEDILYYRLVQQDAPDAEAAFALQPAVLTQLMEETQIESYTVGESNPSKLRGDILLYRVLSGATTLIEPIADPSTGQTDQA